MESFPKKRWGNRSDTVRELLESRRTDGERAVESLLDRLESERGRRPERVLDLGCGTGRHAIPFAERGCEVHGIDFSETLLEQARERAAAAGVADSTELYVGDFRTLDQWGGTYDLVCLFDVLGFYGRETDESLLARARELLADDGALVASLPTKEYVIQELWGSDVREYDDCLCVERAKYDLETSTREGVQDVFAVDGDGYEHVGSVPIRQRVYSPPLLEDLCRRAGFDDVSLSGGFRGEALTLDSPTFVVVAT